MGKKKCYFNHKIISRFNSFRKLKQHFKMDHIDKQFLVVFIKLTVKYTVVCINNLTTKMFSFLIFLENFSFHFIC